MTKKKSAEQIIREAQAREDRDYQLRVSRIKRAVAQAEFTLTELTAVETIVFGAYGRTKLR